MHVSNPVLDLPATRNGLVGESTRPEDERTRFCKTDLTHDDLSGLAFGPYVLGLKLGGGGMGKVYLARHVQLGKEFAVKFITSEAAQCPEARLRFDQEVKALGQLQHPNIVSAVDAGCIEGVPYLATERISGQDLWQLVQRCGPLPVADGCELVRQAALGLAHSHACGIVHRDIKPANLILDRQGVVKILDFGLTRAIQSDQQLTLDGALMGTLDFIAPEQARDARRADERSDLYSLGCTLVHLLSGQPPFHGAQFATPAAKLQGHLLQTPPWLEQAGERLPAQLTRLLGRLLAKEPGKRIATAQEVAESLALFCAGQQVSRLLDDGCCTRLGSVAVDARRQRGLSRPQVLGAGLGMGSLVAVGLCAMAFPFGNMTSAPPAPPPPTAVSAAADSTAQPAAETVAPSPSASPEQPPQVAADEPSPSVLAPQTSEPKQTVNAAAIKVKFSTPAQKNVFQPLSGRTDEPWKQPLQSQ